MIVWETGKGEWVEGKVVQFTLFPFPLFHYSFLLAVRFEVHHLCFRTWIRNLKLSDLRSEI
jgi:hypothetical protein